MGFIVKNTTFCSLPDLVCPHSCKGCGALGDVICDCCKNDILVDHVNYCPYCKLAIKGGSCQRCNLPPTFMVGWRDELIGRLVSDYKYDSIRSLANPLAELLDNVLPIIDGKVAVVPLPTIGKHIRDRGFDHILLLSKKLAQRRDWRVAQVLTRNRNTVQVGANKASRITQAREAYGMNGPIDFETTYLLLDDVWTTGSSMRAALKKLQSAGASKTILAILAVNRTRKH